MCRNVCRQIRICLSRFLGEREARTQRPMLDEEWCILLRPLSKWHRTIAILAAFVDFIRSQFSKGGQYYGGTDDSIASYDGDWNNGRFHGKDEGRLVCANGVSYEGGWKDNRFEGVGILTLPSGVTYHVRFSLSSHASSHANIGRV